MGGKRKGMKESTRRGDFRNIVSCQSEIWEKDLGITLEGMRLKTKECKEGLSACERQQGGVDQLKMIRKVRIRSQRNIKDPANPAQGTNRMQTPEHTGRT